MLCAEKMVDHQENHEKTFSSKKGVDPNWCQMLNWTPL